MSKQRPESKRTFSISFFNGFYLRPSIFMFFDLLPSASQVQKYVVQNLPTFSQKFTYILSKIYLHFIKNLPTFSQKFTYIFSKIYLHFLKNLPTFSQKFSKASSQIFLEFFKSFVRSSNYAKIAS